MTFYRFVVEEAVARARQTAGEPTYRQVVHYLQILKLYAVCDEFLAPLAPEDLDTPLGSCPNSCY